MTRYYGLLICVLSLNIVYSQEQTVDTLGEFEFMETIRGNSYIVEAPILKTGRYLKFFTTSSQLSKEAIEFHPDRLGELQDIFGQGFQTFVSENKEISEKKIEFVLKTKASRSFTIGDKDCHSVSSKEIDVYYSASLIEGKIIYGIMISIPQFQDFYDSLYEIEPGVIVVTEAGSKMVKEALEDYQEK